MTLPLVLRASSGTSDCRFRIWTSPDLFSAAMIRAAFDDGTSPLNETQRDLALDVGDLDVAGQRPHVTRVPSGAVIV